MKSNQRGFLEFGSGEAVDRAALPLLTLREWQDGIVRSVFMGERVASCFAMVAAEPAPMQSEEGVELLAILSADDRNLLCAARTRIAGDSYPSLTPRCPQMHLFEREIAEQAGLRPEGHPWLKPVRFEPSFRPGHDLWNRAGDPLIGEMGYYSLHGAQVHEVAVGPVHAGVIEPGHFRFQCHGETVYHLEISLGYQHRGVERALLAAPGARTLGIAETIAGDTTIGHGLAHCYLLEALGGTRETPRAQVLRAVALELERIANHVGDLGALAGDVGYLPTASYCGRIRGDALNMSAVLCGSRFGRGMLVPGGVRYDIEQPRADDLLRRLDALEKDINSAVDLLWQTPSVMARFENTGSLTLEFCEELGIVGPAARAAGVSRDVRVDQPFGLYNYAHLPISTWETGDVHARAYVRHMEIQQSILFIREQLRARPGGALCHAPGPLAPEKLAVSLVEGWRGEVCHAALTDAQGRIARYKVVDPSFHNWTALAFALRGQQISDFPLCNKSFNLSYCGFDL